MTSTTDLCRRGWHVLCGHHLGPCDCDCHRNCDCTTAYASPLCTCPLGRRALATGSDPHLWLRDEDGTKYHATECWCWADVPYDAPAQGAS